MYTSKSWEYGKKTTLEGDTNSSALQSSPSDLARVSIDASDKMFGVAGYVASKATDQSGLDSSLVKKVESQVGKMISCHGECIVPSVKVGHCVKVNGMDQLDGLFWVKEVKHYFDESGKYHNEFNSTPLDIAFPVKKIKREKLTNLQSALVTGLEDPEGMGRIKVTIPSLGIETLWVRFLTPHAGSDHGWLVMPEIDDEVLVGFENGNPDYPIALGCLYNGQDQPPLKADDKNEEKVFLTKSGNEIRFTDTSGKEKITICTIDGENQIVLDTSGPSVSIKTKGSVNVECDGDMTLKGNNVNIESQANFKIKAGANADIEATANLTAKGNANVDVQAGAMCNVKGTIINLN